MDGAKARVNGELATSRRALIQVAAAADAFSQFPRYKTASLQGKEHENLARTFLQGLQRLPEDRTRAMH